MKHIIFIGILLMLACVSTKLQKVDTTPQTSDLEKTESNEPALHFIALSDINGEVGKIKYQKKVHQGVAQILARKPDMVIGVGDYVAGEDVANKLPSDHFAKMWQVFASDILKPITEAGAIFFPSPGNHDASGYANMKREREAYAVFWNAHKHSVGYVSAEYYPYFYSFKMRDVFFISLDDVSAFTLTQGDKQKKWLREQLASREATQALARVVYGHVPLYPVLDKARHSQGAKGKFFEVLSQEQLAINQKGLESILLEGKVDLAIFAHSHAYFPGRVQRKETRALRILSMPCLGPGNRQIQGVAKQSRRGFVDLQVNAKTGEITYEMFDFAGNRIPKSSLPEKIPQSDPLIEYLRD